MFKHFSDQFPWWLGVLLFVLFTNSTTASEEESVSDAAAVSDINQLSSPDGPEIQSRINGSSELTGIMVDRTITMAGKNLLSCV